MPSRCCPVEVVTKGGTDHKYTREWCNLALFRSCWSIEALIMLIHYSHSWNFLLVISFVMSPSKLSYISKFSSDCQSISIWNWFQINALLPPTQWWPGPCPMSPLVHSVSPRGCQWERSLQAAWCSGHSPGRWSSRRPGGPTGRGYKCLTGTTPGGRGRPDSHRCLLSEHPGGKEREGQRRSQKGTTSTFQISSVGDERTVEAWEKNTCIKVIQSRWFNS